MCRPKTASGLRYRLWRDWLIGSFSFFVCSSVNKDHASRILCAAGFGPEQLCDHLELHLRHDAGHLCNFSPSGFFIGFPAG